MTVGVTRLDLVSGSGDGGGENEGTAGVHATIERDQPTYVRRRCLAHFGWRNANAAFAQAGDTEKEVRKVNVYLNKGITWTQLATIAVSPVVL